MLEFYQAYSEYGELMAMTEELVAEVAARVVGADEVPFGGAHHLVPPPVPPSVAAGTPPPRRRAGGWASRSRRPTCATAHAPAPSRTGCTWRSIRASAPGKIATAIFEALWEESLVQPTFVYDFPTEVSPLSKQKPGRSRHGGAVRALRRRLRGRQRLQRAERPGRAAAALRDAAGRSEARRRRGARDGRGLRARRSSTACRRPAARGSASTGWSCC